MRVASRVWSPPAIAQDGDIRHLQDWQQHAMQRQDTVATLHRTSRKGTVSNVPVLASHSIVKVVAVYGGLCFSKEQVALKR